MVAATLLDLKAARLLPAAEVEDDEDLALLEARDLLFARLLQYRAFKDVAATLRRPDGGGGAPAAARGRRRAPVRPAAARAGARITPEQLGDDRGAGDDCRSRRPTVGLDHLHAPAVSVREQAALIVDRLRRTRSASFRVLIADADDDPWWWPGSSRCWSCTGRARWRSTRSRALGELTIRWTGADDGDVAVVTTSSTGGPRRCGERRVGPGPRSGDGDRDASRLT